MFRFFVSLFCLVTFPSIAQLPQFEKDYSLLVSTGKLPAVFTTTATEKASSDIAIAQKEQNYDKRKAKEDFYLISNFQIDQVLRSGKILFNDSLARFVNRVADEVFKNNPKVRQDLKIFILKSDVVNAFTADDGTIIVSMGLLAQVDNEAQLAFILCHEASHFIKKHSVTSYVTLNTQGGYHKNVLDKYRFSQDAELEADAEGLKLFRETNYSYKGITGAFNMLKYSYLPFDELNFEKSFLEDSDLVFPPAYFLEHLNPVKVEENYDDSKSSHPNIRKRKDNIGRQMGEITDEGRQRFIVDKPGFFRMREMARFELCNIDLQQEEYADCIYEAYVLMKKYPKNKYLQLIIGKALFNVAAAKAPQEKEYKPCIEPRLDIGGNPYVSYDYSSVEGNSQQVYYLLNRLTAHESAITALHYNWKLKKTWNNDTLVNTLCDSLFVLLALNNEVKAEYFTTKTRPEFIRAILPSPSALRDSLLSGKLFAIRPDTSREVISPSAGTEQDEEDSKVTHIRTPQGTSGAALSKAGKMDSLTEKICSDLNDQFDKYALAAMVHDEAFAKKYAGAEERNKQYRNWKYDSPSKYGRDQKNTGGIGIDKIVILDPFYIRTDERIKENFKYYSGEEKLKEYGGILKKNADLVGLQNELVDAHSLAAGDVGRYNDYTIFNDWMSEFLEHGYNRNMLVLGNDAAARLKEKYNTRYILWGGIYNNRTQKKHVVAAVALTIVTLGLIAPVTLPYLVRKEQQTLYFSVLYDLQENEILYTNTTIVRLKDSKDFLNAFVYDTMLTIKTAPGFK